MSIQNSYSLLVRGPFETDLAEACAPRQCNVGLLAYSPLAFGQLTGKYIENPKAHGRLTVFPPNWSPRYMRPRVIEATRRYMQIAKDHGMSATELALAWCYTRNFVASTIIGATTLEQLKIDIDAYQIKLSDEVVNAVNEVHFDFTNPGL